MDAATFIIHSKDGEDVFPLLETKVERYGTMSLHDTRIDIMKKYLEKNLQGMRHIDPIKQIPDPDYYELVIERDIIDENDAAFFHDCSKVIGEIIRETMIHRDPNSEVWKNGLPVFICGGGRRLANYREMIDDRGKKIAKNHSDFRGFEVKDIPKPDQVEAPNLSHGDYDRLAVAYGLSFTADEIGQIIPESKLGDIQKTTIRVSCEDRYVSKDMC